MQCSDPEEMLLKRAVELFWQYRGAILSTLASAYRDHPGPKVDVLYPKGGALVDPQPGTVHHLGHETRRALHQIKDSLDLLGG